MPLLICGIKKTHIHRKTDSDIGKKLVVTNGEREGQATR